MNSHKVHVTSMIYGVYSLQFFKCFQLSAGPWTEICTANDDVWKKKNVQNNIPNMTDQSVAQLCVVSFFSEQKKVHL